MWSLIITSLTQIVLLYIKRRYDLKEIEAGRKKVKDGKLIASPPETEKETSDETTS